ETSRKGLTFHGRLPAPDEGTEKTLAWRDVTKATVVLDANPSLGVYLKRLDIIYGKGKRLRVDNEVPRYVLKDDLALLEELQERVETLDQTFVWYFRICPFCRAPKSADTCEGCGQKV